MLALLRRWWRGPAPIRAFEPPYHTELFKLDSRACEVLRDAGLEP